MFSLARQNCAKRVSQRLFSSSATRQYDVARLILIGRLGKEPELRTTQNNKEYISYSVATTNYPPPPPNPDGSRPAARSSWHNILSFNPSSFDYLKTLNKGAQVYVEANYELREADPTAEPNSPQGQRQIFLRHDMIRVLKPGHSTSTETEDAA